MATIAAAAHPSVRDKRGKANASRAPLRARVDDSGGVCQPPGLHGPGGTVNGGGVAGVVGGYVGCGNGTVGGLVTTGAGTVTDATGCGSVAGVVTVGAGVAGGAGVVLGVVAPLPRNP